MKKGHLKLKEEDRGYLESLIKKGSLKARSYKRAIALLELARGKSYTEVAAIVRATKQSVSIRAKKFREIGLEVLHDKNAREGLR